MTITYYIVRISSGYILASIDWWLTPLDGFHHSMASNIIMLPSLDGFRHAMGSMGSITWWLWSIKLMVSISWNGALMALITWWLSSLDGFHHLMALITWWLSSLDGSHHLIDGSHHLIDGSHHLIDGSHHLMALITWCLSSLHGFHHFIASITIIIIQTWGHIWQLVKSLTKWLNSTSLR